MRHRRYRGQGSGRTDHDRPIGTRSLGRLRCPFATSRASCSAARTWTSVIIRDGRVGTRPLHASDRRRYRARGAKPLRDPGHDKLLTECWANSLYLRLQGYFAGLADKIEGSVVPSEVAAVQRGPRTCADGRRSCRSPGRGQRWVRLYLQVPEAAGDFVRLFIVHVGWVGGLSDAGGIRVQRGSGKSELVE